MFGEVLIRLRHPQKAFANVAILLPGELILQFCRSAKEFFWSSFESIMVDVLDGEPTCARGASNDSSWVA
jgi:hypothetical protein